ncbi:HlyD family type I secretion periplasmic adaptor subunit [Devosia sp. 2618]|uniref:HlyD family type I secretion periplasmic adaptor subunit n=1 Tax=Devosia sp. 2618 TaxID=3156454 RepID=UPI003392207A
MSQQLALSSLPNAPAPKSIPRIMPLMRGTLLVGGLIVAIFFGLFGTWAAMAPLSSGAMASGVVSPDSARKVIQHLEGGIIRTIHVHEGQQVKAGDKLITLESTRQEANFSSGREQWLRLLVIRARLEAHAANAPEMTLPRAVLDAEQPELVAFIANQRSQFATEQRAQLQLADISSRQVAQLDSEIVSIAAETAGLERQKALVDQQYDDGVKLLAQQLISRARVNELQRLQAQLESMIASNAGRTAQANQKIEESRLNLLQSQENFRIKIAEESTQANNQIAVLAADIESTSDVLRRTEITSPVDGVVLNLRNQTVGGIVRPGDPIMDVVPLADDMIVLAKLSPRDIDLVTLGMDAKVNLLPFSSRNILPLHGEVVQIAADSKLDELTRQYYYELRIRVPASQIASHNGLYMSPGMPAEITVVTGARTMLQYLTEPLLRAVNAAFVYD